MKWPMVFYIHHYSYYYFEEKKTFAHDGNDDGFSLSSSFPSTLYSVPNPSEHSKYAPPLAASSPPRMPSAVPAVPSESSTRPRISGPEEPRIAPTNRKRELAVP